MLFPGGILVGLLLKVVGYEIVSGYFLFFVYYQREALEAEHRIPWVRKFGYLCFGEIFGSDL